MTDAELDKLVSDNRKLNLHHIPEHNAIPHHITVKMLEVSLLLFENREVEAIEILNKNVNFILNQNKEIKFINKIVLADTLRFILNESVTKGDIDLNKLITFYEKIDDPNLGIKQID